MADLRQENTAIQESMGHIINLKSLRLNRGFRPQAVPFFSSNGLFAWLMCNFRPSFLHKSDVNVSGSSPAMSTTALLPIPSWTSCLQKHWGFLSRVTSF